MKRIMVDMSATILHNGHINLLKAASELGDVVVALTTDDEILKNKGYFPELNFSQRKTILESIKYVSEVIPSKWLISPEFLIENKIDFLVHGDDNSNNLHSSQLVVLPRTLGVSSSEIRKRAAEILKTTQL